MALFDSTNLESQAYARGDRIDYTPGSAVAAGEVVHVGNGLVGIANTAISASTLGSLQVEGIAYFRKEAGGGVTFAVGENPGWDETNNRAVAPGSGEFALNGKVIATAADADDYVLVKLNSVGSGGGIKAEEVTFTEAGDTTYTGSVTVPAGGIIHDILVIAVALWDDGTSASMKVGDAADDDGYYTGVDLKATDLLADETISFAAQGGVGGAYLTAGTNTHFTDLYSATARVVSGVVTTGGQDGTAGRTRMVVLYSLPNSTAATGA